MKQRHIFYSAIAGIKNSVLRTLLDNMALTLRLHPWSLMIEAKETGRVSLGLGVTLTLELITNVAIAADVNKKEGFDAIYKRQDCHQRMTLNKCHVYEIPIKIARISNPRSTGIRAVIVVKHRNIGAKLA